MGVNFAFFQGADQEAIASGSLNLCKLACDLFSDGERVKARRPSVFFGLRFSTKKTNSQVASLPLTRLEMFCLYSIFGRFLLY